MDVTSTVVLSPFWQDQSQDQELPSGKSATQPQPGNEIQPDWRSYLELTAYGGLDRKAVALQAADIADIARADYSGSRGRDLGTHPSLELRFSNSDDSNTIGSSGLDGGSDGAKEKAESAKARNRRAVRKFREKQKAKALEKDAILQDVTARFAQLLKEKEELQMQNMVLQLRCDIMPSGQLSKMGDPGDEGQCPEFIPFGGWRDFDPTSVLILKVRDPPLRLTSACVAAMSMSDFIPIWKMYINAMAILLPLVDDSPKSPALEQLEGLKNEITAVCAYFGLFNPPMLHELQSCCLMDSSEVAQGLRRRSPAEWHAIAEVLKLTACQQEMLLRARDLHDRAMHVLRLGQREVEEALQELDRNGQPLRAGPQFLRMVAASKGLTRNLEQAHRVTCIFGTQTWGMVLDPVQFATFMVTSFPWTGDMWGLIEWVESRQSAGRPLRDLEHDFDGDGSAVSCMMSENFQDLWKWHSTRMTEANSGEALQRVPAAINLLA